MRVNVLAIALAIVSTPLAFAELTWTTDETMWNDSVVQSSVQMDDFEGYPLGMLGGTLTNPMDAVLDLFTLQTVNNGVLYNQFPAIESQTFFLTTGQNFVGRLTRMQPGDPLSGRSVSHTFLFNSPQRALAADWGSMTSGQIAQVTVNFDDQTTSTTGFDDPVIFGPPNPNLPDNGANGTGFAGFLATKPFSSITFTAIGQTGTTAFPAEDFAVDNLKIASAVPEPTTAPLLAVGLAVAAFARRRRRRR